MLTVDQATSQTKGNQARPTRSVPRVLRFAPPSVLTPDELVRLQRSVGNEAVEQLLTQRLDALAHKKPIDFTAPVTVVVDDGVPDVTKGQSSPEPDPYAKTPGTVGTGTELQGPGNAPVGPTSPWSQGNRPFGPRTTPLIGQRDSKSPDPYANSKSPSPVSGPASNSWQWGFRSHVPAKLSVLGSGRRSDPYARSPGSLPAPTTAPMAQGPSVTQALEVTGSGSGARVPKSLKTTQGYLKLKSRRSEFENEFTSVSESMKRVMKFVESGLQRGEFPDTTVEGVLMHAFGWTEDDCKKYGKFLKDPTKQYKKEETPVVTAVQPNERYQYELHFGSTITRGTSTTPYDTTAERSQFLGSGYAIYVMDQQGKFYAGNQKVGLFHHSSLIGGGQVAGAGELQVKNGELKFLSNESGHYRPGIEQCLQVLEELRSQRIDLSKVEFKFVSSWDEPKIWNAEQLWNVLSHSQVPS
ncbi:hypothetical protein Afer_0544 [Acidimicrobium ferrooxidans DSM 10331]|uniref:Uncharacterized protein n=1 Tax=Acidimicrobium ferrooxidans (strain DSM 10331 / JCM 15462 / NBRC 103882 / ICP) TaxID=525909 RepID=C7M3B1_ACIFD|nr:hypothetical protein [Acidimicrobium ferrooxidans]ACU53505.1 hypothetical protein Afer_0544 [Acidimicrobium ferrooxidans DSM 10331]